ncbi:MAG: response regulator [Proteobacteria bacterium]|nr:response regulator [Pseudomonadota bacterium]
MMRKSTACSIARFASSVLEASGYQTLHVTEGAAALTEVRRARYDLVLLDVNMPALSGWEVLNELLSVRSGQAVVMISGYALEREAIERGARGLVQKPFNGAVLRQAVAGALLQPAG